ncbi:hypothetical protein PGN35_004600 [Nodosilinea sp. PGN35]|uniref:hypothetical protein n=1 Tax=Nodosilinea sp. PGN35 TaxID=3020489 RepID=UPI0023B311FF|nr:hypothetical protein [Nodosilinea sp. TSF1-S3]MDF0365901.1 hypothetical protein [Nodosilinea sp. TSF1-S3]
MSARNNNPRNRDFETSINTRPATRDEIAYRDGYIRGKSAEQLEYERRRAAEARMHEENARLRADNGVSVGLVLGLVLAAVAAVVGGIVYVSSTDGTVTPTPEATTPEPANNETTIIERTIERTQEVVPAPRTVETPQINVELNNPLEQNSAPAPAPAGEAQAPAPTQESQQ